MCPWTFGRQFLPGADAAPAAPPAGLLGLLASPRPDRGALGAAMQALRPESIPALIEALSFHRIEGLAHRNLTALPHEAIDPWLRSTLRRRAQRLAAATLAQGLALADLLDALHGARVPVAVMRGLRSVEAIYDDPSARPFEDHDLLVLPGDRAQAAAVLERLGLEPVSRGLFRRGGLLVDLHTDPIGAARRPTRSLLFALSAESLFERATPGTVAGAPTLLLESGDELLLLAIHLVKHSFDRLIRIADIAHLLARPDGAAHGEAALRRAEIVGGGSILASALAAAAPLGVPMNSSLRACEPSGAVASAILRRVVRLRPVPFAGEILMMLALPGWAARLRFLCDALAPKDRLVRPEPSRPAVLSRHTVSIVRQPAATRRRRTEAR